MLTNVTPGAMRKKCLGGTMSDDCPHNLTYPRVLHAACGCETVVQVCYMCNKEILGTETIDC